MLPPHQSPSFIHLTWSVLHDKKRYLIGFLCINLLQAGEISLSPYLLKRIIDSSVLHTQTFGQPGWTTWQYLCAYVLVALIMNCMMRGYNFLAIRFYTQLQSDITHKLHRMIITKRIARSVGHPGESAKRIQDIAKQLDTICHISCDIFFPKVGALISANYSICVVAQAKFALCLVSWSIVFILITVLAARQAQTLSGAVTQKNHQLNRFLIDSIATMQHAYPNKNKSKTTSSLSYHLGQSQLKTQALRWFKLKLAWKQSLSINILLGLLLYGLIIETSQQTLSAGDFMFVVNLTLSLIISTQNIGICMIRYAKVIGSCQNNLQLLYQAEHQKHR